MQEVRQRFGSDIEAAAAGGLSSWRHGYEALASVVLQDQLTRSALASMLKKRVLGMHLQAERARLPSRNMYRGTPHMYSLDGQALELAKALVVRSNAQQCNVQLHVRLRIVT